MKRPRVLCIVVAVLIVAWFFRPGGERFDEIEYHGQAFKLSKSYSDYEDYKDDPGNLAPGQQAQIEQAIRAARLEPTYATREELIRASSNVRFPGYGITTLGERPQPDGSVLAAHIVEIPLSMRQRVFVYQKTTGPYVLVDDFVDEGGREIVNVALKNGQLEYADLQGQLITAHPLPQRK